MNKIKKKIYLIELWLHIDSVNVEIYEFNIKRKGKDNIQTYEGKELYTYMLDKPLSGIIIGENEINVSMLTEDILNIDRVISKMIDAGKKQIRTEIKYLINMYEELNCLNKFDREIIFSTSNNGMYHIEKHDSDIIMNPFIKDNECISIKDYIERG